MYHYVLLLKILVVLLPFWGPKLSMFLNWNLAHKGGSIRLVHVVWDFRPWDVMTKVCYFLMLHFQFSSFWDAHRVKMQVDQGLWQVSRSCSQIINLNRQKITYFRHYVPWTKIPDDMNKSFAAKKLFCTPALVETLARNLLLYITLIKSLLLKFQYFT